MNRILINISKHPKNTYNIYTAFFHKHLLRYIWILLIKFVFLILTKESPGNNFMKFKRKILEK